MLQDSGDTFSVDLHLRRADGKTVLYSLWIDASSSDVSVREDVPNRLPTWCPELHINADGFFCLGWGKDAPPPVVDAASAERWWGIVWSFLILQERAAVLKRWPNNNSWAHGIAADFQQHAESFAGQLSHDTWRALRAGRLAIKKRKRGVYRVLRDGKRFYSIVSASGRVDGAKVVNMRRPCLCGSGTVMRNCGRHVAAAAGLALAMATQNTAEALFWDVFKDRACCGRVPGCPLAAERLSVAA